MWEILVILALALIFIGPKKLPEIARTLGKGLREFRRATDDLKHTVSVDDDYYPPDTAPPAKSAEIPDGDESRRIAAEDAEGPQTMENPAESPEGSSVANAGAPADSAAAPRVESPAEPVTKPAENVKENPPEDRSGT